MDNPAQALQNATDETVLACLRNEVILREILGHFSSKELILLSCVNKLWNHEARRMMRERGNVVAKIKPPNLCAQAEAFGSALENIKVVFFSAITIYFPYDFAHACGCGDELPRIRPERFSQQLSLKSADFLLRGPWWSYPNCPAIQLAKIVLQQSSGSLEELWLEVGSRQEDFIRQVFQEQDCYFPRLKCLTMSDDAVEVVGRDYANYIKPLVSRAPNLQELYIETLDYYSRQALEGCRAGVIQLGGPISAPFDEIPENFISAVRLTNVELFYTGPEFNFVRFNRIAPVLLQASQNTLSRLDICALLLPSLISYGVRLEDLYVFEMDINLRELERSQPGVLVMLKNFNFARTFPNLEKVTMNRSYVVPGPLPFEMNRMLEEAEAILMEPEPDRSVNIKKLVLNGGLYKDAPELWAHMFPSIRKLRLGKGAGNNLSEDFPIASIWERWPDVEKIKVSLRDMRGIFPTADSAFYGIFPEECAELRDKDEEYLKKVNIVPVAPGISCFRSLKTLILDFYSGVFAQDHVEPELTRLKRLIAFAKRRPGLAIILKTRWIAIYEALKEMEPYATVVLQNYIHPTPSLSLQFNLNFEVRLKEPKALRVILSKRSMK